MIHQQRESGILVAPTTHRFADSLQLVFVSFLTLLMTIVPYANAQCTGQWLPGYGTLGGGGYLRATTLWDADGSGPLPSRLVVGGSFVAADTVQASNIAAYDLTTGAWSALGSGIVGHYQFSEVSALTARPNGELIVGGDFYMAGGVNIGYGIARWNGTTWLPMGSGMNDTVDALTTLPNGDVVAGGGFTTAGGVAANHIARWDGTAWSPLGTGINGRVSALISYNGALIAAGNFTIAGTVAANSIARWDGTAWSVLGSGMNRTVYALATLTNGNLVAGGSFDNAGGVNIGFGMAQWNGTVWSTMNSGVSGGRFSVRALTTLPNGNLVAGGQFTNAGPLGIVAANYVAVWSGTTWSAIGPGTDDFTFALTTLPNGDLVAGGNFNTAGNVSAHHVARWNGAAWSSLGSGLRGGGVFAMATLPNGDFVTGGDFTTAGSASVNHIASWNGAAAAALGSGMGGANEPYVQALATRPNGDVIAGGWFTAAGGVATGGLARWNGTAWSGMGLDLNEGAEVLLTMPNGDDVVAGGNFTTAGGLTVNGIARWNGTVWSALGSGISGGYSFVAALTATSPNGNELVAGGSFTTAGGVAVNSVARWNGTTWSAMGSGVTGGQFGGVVALAKLPNGDVVAGGDFTAAGGVPARNIALWNGSTWSAMGAGMDSWVSALATLPNGNVVAAGEFTTAGGVTVNHIALWNGSTWYAMGSGMNGTVRVLAALPNGDVMAGGAFTTAGGHPYEYWARYSVCIADFDDGSGTGVCDGGVTIDDLLYYLSVYGAGVVRADIDDGSNTGTPDGGVGIEDLLYYLTRYDSGC